MQLRVSRKDVQLHVSHKDVQLHVATYRIIDAQLRLSALIYL